MCFNDCNFFLSHHYFTSALCGFIHSILYRFCIDFLYRFCIDFASFLPCDRIWLRSQSAFGKHNQEMKAHIPLRTSRISKKQMCRPCLIIIKSCYFDYRINKPFIRNSRCLICFFLCSLDIDVRCAQRIIGFFILITHKSMRSENPITQNYVYYFTNDYYIFCYFRMGAGHDGSKAECPNNKFIMSSALPGGTSAFKWSPCSQAALQSFL